MCPFSPGIAGMRSGRWVSGPTANARPRDVVRHGRSSRQPTRSAGRSIIALPLPPRSSTSCRSCSASRPPSPPRRARRPRQPGRARSSQGVQRASAACRVSRRQRREMGRTCVAPMSHWADQRFEVVTQLPSNPQPPTSTALHQPPTTAEGSVVLPGGDHRADRRDPPPLRRRPPAPHPRTRSSTHTRPAPSATGTPSAVSSCGPTRSPPPRARAGTPRAACVNAARATAPPLNSDRASGPARAHPQK